ncbi:MAG: glycosyltransferase family 2 protein [Candidatus Woesearchaeota archaeon]
MKCVLIPTLNEGKTIGKVLDDMPKGLDVYIVDGLSTDNTVKIAREKGAKIIIEKRKGKGNAVKSAFEKLNKYDKVVMLDGDYTYNPKDIPRFFEKLNKFDIVFGKRLIDKKAMKITHRIGNFLLTLTANLLYKKKISDLCTGYIGFSKKALKKINITAQGFDLEANIFAQSAKKDLEIEEIPIKYSESEAVSKLNGFSDGSKIIKMLIKQKFTE